MAQLRKGSTIGGFPILHQGSPLVGASATISGTLNAAAAAISGLLTTNKVTTNEDVSAGTDGWGGMFIQRGMAPWEDVLQVWRGGSLAWTLRHDPTSGYAKFTSGLIVTNTADLAGGITVNGTRVLDNDRNFTGVNGTFSGTVSAGEMSLRHKLGPAADINLRSAVVFRDNGSNADFIMWDDSTNTFHLYGDSAIPAGSAALGGNANLQANNLTIGDIVMSGGMTINRDGPVITLQNTITANSASSGRINFFEQDSAYGAFVTYDGAANFFHLGVKDAGTEYNALSITRNTRAVALAGALSGTSATFSGTATASGVVAGSARLGTSTTYANMAQVINNALTENGGNYALLQDTAGNTYLNAATGQSLNLRVNNAAIATLTDTSFSVYKNLVMSMAGTPQLQLANTNSGEDSGWMTFYMGGNRKGYIQYVNSAGALVFDAGGSTNGHRFQNGNVYATGAIEAANTLKVNGRNVAYIPNSNSVRTPINPLYGSVRMGKQLTNFVDEEFANGSNNLIVYSNSGVAPIITRIDMADAPNSTRKVLEIKHAGVSSPGYGGFITNFNGILAHTLVQVFRAKVPVGYNLAAAENGQGTNGGSYWLTTTAGTGKWEEYVRVSHSGDGGTFNGGGHVYLTNAGGAAPTVEAPVIWYVASCTVFDAHDFSSVNVPALAVYGISTLTPSALNVGSTNVTAAGYTVTRRAGAVTASHHFFIPGNNSPSYEYIYGGTWSGEYTGTADVANALYHRALPNNQFDWGKIAAAGAFTSTGLTPLMKLDTSGFLDLAATGGGLKIQGTQVLDNNRNATVANLTTSGTITAGTGSTLTIQKSGAVFFYAPDGWTGMDMTPTNARWINVISGTKATSATTIWGIERNDTWAHMLDIKGDGSYISQGTASFVGGYQIAGTTVIDSSRYVTTPKLYLTDTETLLSKGSGDSVRIDTLTGYVEVGSQNASYSHFSTDRPKFYFNKAIAVEGGFEAYHTSAIRWTLGTRVNSTNYSPYFSARVDAPAFSVSSNPFDETSGSPWYGLGMSNLTALSTTAQTAVQLAGYFGLRMRTSGATLDLFQNGKMEYTGGDTGTEFRLASKGNVILTLDADTDNVTETDHPEIRLLQDQQGIAARIRLADTFVDGTGGGNHFQIYFEDDDTAAGNFLTIGTSGGPEAIKIRSSDGLVNITKNMLINSAVNYGPNNHQILNGTDTWFRTRANEGIYFATHSTGLHATDANEVKVYNNKGFYAAAYVNTGGKIQEGGNALVPAGSIMAFAGSAAPGGWLMCNGQAVSRTTYANLFTAIGTTYGAGDGTTTFNLPDLRGRVVGGLDNMGGAANANRVNRVNARTLGGAEGAETHLLTGPQSGVNDHGHAATQDSHTHGVTDPGHSHSDPTWTGSNGSTYEVAQYGTPGYDYGKAAPTSGSGTGVYLDWRQPIVSISGSGDWSADEAHENVQPTLFMNYIIKI